MSNRINPAVLGITNRSASSGKALAALLIYLAVFAFALLLLLHGYRSLAFIALVGVWAILAFWLQKGGR